MASLISFTILTIPLLFHLASAAGPFPANASVNFDYTSMAGPQKWGKLCPQYAACSKGKLQSPVNILTNQTVLTTKFEPLIRDYYYTPKATLFNNGHSVEVTWDDGSPGAMDIEGKQYNLSQVHWHTPSEHRINGEQFAAELHLVNKAADGSFSVVAILFRYGVPDPLVSKIKNGLVELAKDVSVNEGAHVPLGKMVTEELRKKSRKYYRYDGSFTTPPCTEHVTWTILAKVRSMSKEQVQELKAPLSRSCKFNSRPVQPLNGRKILLFDNLTYYH